MFLASVARAQFGRRPTDQLGQVLYETINGVSGGRDTGWTVDRLRRATPNDVASASPFSSSPFRRNRHPGQPGVGYSPMPLMSSQRSGSTTLLGRRYGGFGLPSAGGYGGGVYYPELTRESPGLLMRRPDLVTAGDSGAGLAAVPLHEPPSSRPADDFTPRIEPVPIEVLVRDYVETRRKTYVTQGWEKFKSGEYRAAGDLFALGANVCLDDPAARAELELARVFAAVGTRQYFVASSSLRWLLTPSRRTGQLPDPGFLSRAADIEGRYGEKPDLQLQAREVESLAMANPDAAEYQALRCVLLLARGDRVGAAFYARSMPAETPAPWPVLQTLLERTDARGADVAPRAAAVTTPDPSPILLPQTLATPK